MHDVGEREAAIHQISDWQTVAEVPPSADAPRIAAQAIAPLLAAEYMKPEDIAAVQAAVAAAVEAAVETGEGVLVRYRARGTEAQVALLTPRHDWLPDGAFEAPYLRPESAGDHPLGEGLQRLAEYVDDAAARRIGQGAELVLTKRLT